MSNTLEIPNLYSCALRILPMQADPPNWRSISTDLLWIRAHEKDLGTPDWCDHVLLYINRVFAVAEDPAIPSYERGIAYALLVRDAHLLIPILPTHLAQKLHVPDPAILAEMQQLAANLLQHVSDTFWAQVSQTRH